MKNIKYLLLSAVLIGFTACNDEEDFEDLLDNPTTGVVLPELTSGSADFSNYVAVGASFTAGYTDGALFIAAQENSFPNMLANKFSNIGGGTFTQPLMSDNIGGLLIGGMQDSRFSPRFYFYSDQDPEDDFDSGPYPVGVVPHLLDFTPKIPTTETLAPISGPFNNLGIPGAKSFHLIAPGFGNAANLSAGLANPYAVRVTGNAPNASILELAIAENPTFFTLSEVGGNDVLGYATSGGDGTNPITPTGTFDFALNTLVTGLTANGAKGVIGNLPNITSLSHFTTVPHNPIPLDAATAGFLNSVNAYGAYNAGIVQAFAYVVATTPMTQEMADAEIAKRTITFSAGEGNAVVMMDENLTDLTPLNPALVSMRQATADDLIVLLAKNFIGTEAIPGNPQTVNGVAIPLADKWVLTPEEQEEIAIATQAYNATISSVASSNGLALVDLNSILEQASSVGINFDSYFMNTNLATGGLISLDGVHLTARGYALMANSFFKAIDATYGSNFEASGSLEKAGDYPTNYSADSE